MVNEKAIRMAPEQLEKELEAARMDIDAYKRAKVEMHKSAQRMEDRADNYLSMFLLYASHLSDCDAYGPWAFPEQPKPCSCGLDIELALVRGDDPPPRGWHSWRLMAMRLGLKERA